MFIDSGLERCSRLQFFTEIQGNEPDAIDILDDVYKDMYESYAWGTGIKRLMIDDRGLNTFNSQVKKYSSYFYSLLIDFKNFMFTCHKLRREFYMYYCTDYSGSHDLDFCGTGYMCFEMPYTDDNIKKLSMFIGIITSVQRPGIDSGLPLCTAGEFRIIQNKGILKFKLMPGKNLLDDEEYNNILGHDFMKTLRDSKK